MIKTSEVYGTPQRSHFIGLRSAVYFRRFGRAAVRIKANLLTVSCISGKAHSPNAADADPIG